MQKIKWWTVFDYMEAACRLTNAEEKTQQNVNVYSLQEQVLLFVPVLHVSGI